MAHMIEPKRLDMYLFCRERVSEYKGKQKLCEIPNVSIEALIGLKKGILTQEEKLKIFAALKTSITMELDIMDKCKKITDYAKIIIDVINTNNTNNTKKTDVISQEDTEKQLGQKNYISALQKEQKAIETKVKEWDVARSYNMLSGSYEYVRAEILDKKESCCSFLCC